MPGAWSVRVLCVCAHLAALVLAAAHSGALISALSAGSPRLPFNSLKEVLDDPRVRFIIVQNSGLIGYFDRAHDSAWAAVGRRIRAAAAERAPPPSPLDGFREACAAPRTVLILGREARDILRTHVPCATAELPFALTRTPVAFALAKRSPYTQLLSHQIRCMWRSGILDRVVRRRWPRSPPPSEEQPQLGVRLGDVVPLFSALAAGALLALSLLAAECVVARWRRRSVVLNTLRA